MIEVCSEITGNPLEAFMEEGESLVVRLHSLGQVSFRTADCQSVNSDIADFLGRLFKAIPPDDKNQQVGEINGIVHSLTAVSRNSGEMLINYVMRVSTEFARRRVLGTIPGHIMSSGEVVIRPAFGAQMPHNAGAGKSGRHRVYEA